METLISIGLLFLFVVLTWVGASLVDFLDEIVGRLILKVRLRKNKQEISEIRNFIFKTPITKFAPCELSQPTNPQQEQQIKEVIMTHFFMSTLT